MFPINVQQTHRNRHDAYLSQRRNAATSTLLIGSIGVLRFASKPPRRLSHGSRSGGGNLSVRQSRPQSLLSHQCSTIDNPVAVWAAYFNRED